MEEEKTTEERLKKTRDRQTDRQTETETERERDSDRLKFREDLTLITTADPFSSVQFKILMRTITRISAIR